MIAYHPRLWSRLQARMLQLDPYLLLFLVYLEVLQIFADRLKPHQQSDQQYAVGMLSMSNCQSFSVWSSFCLVWAPLSCEPLALTRTSSSKRKQSASWVPIYEGSCFSMIWSKPALISCSSWVKARAGGIFQLDVRLFSSHQCQSRDCYARRRRTEVQYLYSS